MRKVVGYLVYNTTDNKVMYGYSTNIYIKQGGAKAKLNQLNNNYNNNNNKVYVIKPVYIDI